LLVDGNLTSAMYCAHAVLPAMRAQGDGILLHTASGAGRWVSLLSGPGYTAAKHGLVAMSHQLNMSECVNGIRSMAICPGEIATPILKNRPIPLTQQELDRMLRPEDVADLMLYCARLPRHVNLNEVVMLPSWNRAYVAALENQARERAAKGA
jgi:NADP-dependent 3-hydroxy acid dehydrogenase YdfG